ERGALGPQQQFWLLARDAAETDMAGRCIDRLGMPSRRPIAPAIVGRTEIRSALQDFARYPVAWLTGVVALVLLAAAGALRDTAWLGGIRGMTRTEALGGPFPDVADHVVEAVLVGGERSDRGGAFVAVLGQVLPGKLALPGVGHHLAARVEVVAPGEFGVVVRAASGKLPFRFPGQILTRPACVGECILVSNVDDWMVADALDAAARAKGVAPVGALHKGPPVAPVVGLHALEGTAEHQRSRIEHVLERAGIGLGIGR